jgi:hypothetical protein
LDYCLLDKESQSSKNELENSSDNNNSSLIIIEENPFNNIEKKRKTKVEAKNFTSRYEKF